MSKKWTDRVGMYNDDPIWAEVVQGIQVSRKPLKVRPNTMATHEELAEEIVSLALDMRLKDSGSPYVFEGNREYYDTAEGEAEWVAAYDLLMKAIDKLLELEDRENWAHFEPPQPTHTTPASVELTPRATPEPER